MGRATSMCQGACAILDHLAMGELGELMCERHVWLSYIVDGGGDAQRLEQDWMRDSEGVEMNQGTDGRRISDRGNQSLIMRER
jgi:hypothetical protein